ncbi:hypothetical protein EJB05_24599, partial [Eragrostis curvula]
MSGTQSPPLSRFSAQPRPASLQQQLPRLSCSSVAGSTAAGFVAAGSAVAESPALGLNRRRLCPSRGSSTSSRTRQVSVVSTVHGDRTQGVHEVDEYVEDVAIAGSFLPFPTVDC